MEDLFDRIDVDHDGVISRKELASAVMRGEVAEVMGPPVICPFCGNHYTDDALYCRKCGKHRPGKPEDESRGRAPDKIHDLTGVLDAEERELWRQLRRKSEFERRVQDTRARLVELRDKRRGVTQNCVEASVAVDKLSGQVDFARLHEREIEHDIAVLRESNRILQAAFVEKVEQARRQGPVDSNQLRADILAHESARQEKLQQQWDQITHLRTHLERMLLEKIGLQQRQQMLIDKQHAAEQDRNLLLSSLQDQRKGINDLRLERLTLWEGRHGMEQEMTSIVVDAHHNAVQAKQRRGPTFGVDPSIIAAEENFRLGSATLEGNLVGGVRNPVVKDTPLAFGKDSSAFAWSADEGRMDVPKTWSKFGAQRSEFRGGL